MWNYLIAMAMFGMSLVPFTRVRTNFWTNEFFTCATRLHGTVQIPLQIALLFAVQQKLHGSAGPVQTKGGSVQVFVPEKNCLDPCKRGRLSAKMASRFYKSYEWRCQGIKRRITNINTWRSASPKDSGNYENFDKTRVKLFRYLTRHHLITHTNQILTFTFQKNF